MGIRRSDSAIRAARSAAAVLACLALANCASSGKFAGRVDPKYGVSSSPRVVEYGEPVPKGGGTYRVGKPYTVAGRIYVPEEDVNYREEGLASWYGDDFHGRQTANGEVFDMTSLTAAHPTLPMPCYVRVTNLGNIAANCHVTVRYQVMAENLGKVDHIVVSVGPYTFHTEGLL